MSRCRTTVLIVFTRCDHATRGHESIAMRSFNQVSGRRLVACLVAILVMTGIAFWPATADDERPEVVTALLDSPSVERVGPNTLRIDISDERVTELLTATGDHLDGWTFETTGIAVFGPDARRTLDAKMLDIGVSHDGELGDPCPSVPTGDRESGVTTPYLSCDADTGVEVFGEAVQGALPDSAARAAYAVIRQSVPVDEKDVTATEHESGDITVSVSQKVGERLSTLAFGDAAMVLNHLMFTFHSNAGINKVTLTIDGDCRAFALAVGGDMCGPIHYRIRVN